MEKTVLIIGAGPAGLSAAHALVKAGIKVQIFESDSSSIGGLSKTVHYKGFSFDIGGHRFYTKAPEVEAYWRDILKNDFLTRKRLSRIYYGKKFFQYPLQVSDVIAKINPLKAASFLSSYLYAALKPPKTIKSFEDWIVKNFGRSLFNAFFKSYTEKVWGRPCTEISSDWAAQRINNLNIGSLIKGFLTAPFRSSSDADIKSLIEEFQYPRKGPGMLWEKVSQLLLEAGATIEHGAKVIGCEQGTDDLWRLRFSDGTTSEQGTHVISSAPIKTLLSGLKPTPTPSVLESANDFKYRDFVTVVLMFKLEKSFPDNWIYIHDDSVKVARIQNYKNWSPEMVPSKEYTSYGLEYFCQQGDSFWNSSDEDLFKLAIEEVQKIGLPFRRDELDYKVVRVEKAYPVYDHDHNQRSLSIRSEIKNYRGLHLVGRNGMHRYNNQDHSIKTAMLTAENIIAGKELCDPWLVNQDAIYLETDS